jgi:hypothetical protein
MRRLVLLLVIACAPTSAAAVAPYLAGALDRAGRLDEALPLYAERAAATLTTADRLRHGALLRAGRDDDARAIYDVLRHAVALWKLARMDDAAAEAARASETDEEAVRSAALVLESAADLAEGRSDLALARLEALGGHDVRFAEPIARVVSAFTGGTALRDAATDVMAALHALDRSREPMTTALVEILLDAAGRATLIPVARAGAPAPFPAPARETSVATAP